MQLIALNQYQYRIVLDALLDTAARLTPEAFNDYKTFSDYDDNLNIAIAAVEGVLNGGAQYVNADGTTFFKRET